MLWIKAFHIVFVVSWFAGLFYLPRLFVNLSMLAPEAHAERSRLLLMANKLYKFMSPLTGLALALGFWLWLGIGIGKGAGWMHAKLVVVFALVAYHGYCGAILKRFEAGTEKRSHLWFRWFNEAPVVLLVLAVVLVVVKPF